MSARTELARQLCRNGETVKAARQDYTAVRVIDIATDKALRAYGWVNGRWVLLVRFS